VSTKIVKALALGTPVITTPEGLGGMITLDPDLPVIVAKADHFVATVVAAYNDSALWDKYHLKSVAFVEKNFGWSHLLNETAHTMQEVKRLYRPDAPPARRRLSVVWDLPPTDEDKSSLASIYELMPYLGEFDIKVADTGCPLSGSSAIDVVVRLRRLPDLSRPTCCPRDSCKFIVYLVWDLGILPVQWVRLLNANADAVWALSTFHAMSFHDSGVDGRLIRNVPFGFNCHGLKPMRRDLRSELSIPSGKHVFGLILGTLSHDAADFVLQQYLVKKSNTEAVLLIFGQYKHPLELSEESRFRVITDSTLTMDDMIHAADVFIFPDGSGWSLAPLEALAAKKVIMAPAHGALRDYLYDSDYSNLYIATREPCVHYPCVGSGICLLPPKNGSTKNECLELDSPPWWLHLDAFKLRKYMWRVLAQHRLVKGQENLVSRYVCSSFRWSDVASVYAHELHRVAHHPSVEENNTWAYSADYIPSFIRPL
jgi:glycosyltransferase involved in cell wall biosynthesis